MASGPKRGVGGFSEWKCAICGEPVIEGQRFVLIPGKGYAHIECLAAKAASEGRLSGDALAYYLASEALSYAIVRLKEAERVAGSDEAARRIESVRHRVEDLAGELEALLAGAVGES